MSEHLDFIKRVAPKLPTGTPASFTFHSWKHGGRPTKEGVGALAIPGVNPDKFVEAVFDLDHYQGNIEHVTESRTIADARFELPDSQRFYQAVNIPVLGTVQQELVLHRAGEHNGYQVVAWHLLRPETDALSTKKGFRSDYNVGAWFVKEGVVGYALASAPKRDDVGWLKFKALTKGADAAASKVLKANIEGMARWAARR